MLILASGRLDARNDPGGRCNVEIHVSVRLIAGRAGSGKTHHCLSEIRAELERRRVEGPRLMFLVPEQAGLQMERALLSMLDPPALGRCEVLSFRRLAHRILGEAAGPSPTPLTAIGRQMALRHLIARNRRKLREFGKVADRGGFLTAVSGGMVELLQEAVTPEQLDQAATAAQDEGDPSAPRLHDMALIFRAYLEFLGSDRVDPEAVLDLARARLGQLAWPDGARIWIDGFAGLTQQQTRMIVALAQRAADVEVALLLDPMAANVFRAIDPPDDLSLFARTERTWFALSRILRESGVAMEEPLLLRGQPLPRYRKSPALAALEQNLFRVHALPTQQARPHRKAADATPELETDAAHGHVHLIRAADRRAEVEAAVTALVDRVQRDSDPLRYRDAAIVVRDLTDYHDILSAALAARGIPFFIDRRRPTTGHPLVQFVRGLLAMHGETAFDQCIFMLLKTGLSGLIDADAEALENYLLAHGMISAAAWDEDWNYPPIPGKPESADKEWGRQVLEGIYASRAQLRERIGAWWPGDDAANSRNTCGDWVKALYGVLERFAVRDGLRGWCSDAAMRGDLDEAEEHQQVWADLMKLLDEAVEALGDEPMSGRQFRDVIESGLTEFTVGLVPATLDQVLVSSIERSRHPPVRAVFVLGFGEGLFPGRPTEDPVFNDEDRARLERSGIALGQTRVRQLLDERMLAYIAFTRPSDFLWISYPESDEAGKPLSPSPYWPAVQAATGIPVIDADRWLLAGRAWPKSLAAASSVSNVASSIAEAMRAWCAELLPTSETPSWTALYEWARATPAVRPSVAAVLAALAPPHPLKLTDKARESLWRRPHRTSVTALERFAECPFAHYASYGLRLEPRPVHEISALDMGRIYHTILEQFVNELNETGRTLRELSAGEIAENLSRLCQHVVPKYAEDLRMEPGKRRGAVWRSKRELPAAKCGEQAALGKAALQTVKAECEFGLDLSRGLPALKLKTAKGDVVELRGKIDRVDLLQAGDTRLGVVFDYKRALGRRLDLDEVYYGLALQLLAYLLVLQEFGEKLTEGKIVPGGAFYLPLLAGYKKVDHPSDVDADELSPYKVYRPRGILDFDWIDHLDPSKKTGWSDALSVFRNKDGGLGNENKSDAIPNGKLPLLLDHVRKTMISLIERWLSGDISVWPVIMGNWSPCEHCLYRGVCRIEYVTREGHRLEKMKRTDVLQRIADDSIVAERGGSDE